MWMLKIFDALACPITLIKCQVYRLNSVKREAIRILNGLIDGAPYNAKDYKVHAYVFGGFSIKHRKTGKVLASAHSMKYQYLDIKKITETTKFFPHQFAQDSHGKLRVSESICFWFEKGLARQISSQIDVKPFKDKFRGIGAEEPYYNTITVELDGDLNISKIHKEVYDLGEMYGNRINFTTFPSHKSLDEIFITSNEFINEKVTD